MQKNFPLRRGTDASLMVSSPPERPNPVINEHACVGFIKIDGFCRHFRKLENLLFFSSWTGLCRDLPSD